MSKFIIIFDGIEDHAIERDLFYDCDLIRSRSNDEIREIAKFTIAYSNLIKNENTKYSKQVEEGCILMSDLVGDIDYLNRSNLKLQKSLI